ncbi:MAG: hypothetical protein J6Q40_04455 [Tidjanibacter sp.]|nr:hypothetical protein [Tidjanibacter sp.]
MNWIKLTENADGRAVYIKDERISCIIEEDRYTEVYLQGDSTPVCVDERPTQILDLLLD